jgi:hypothetical protein
LTILAAQKSVLLLRKMRWTILMSTGDCFQAAYSVDLKLAGGATMNEQRAKGHGAERSWTADREDFLHHFE